MYRVFLDTLFLLTGYLFTFGQETLTTNVTITPTITTTTSAISSTTASTTKVRRLIPSAAVVHSHFADCPDSHRHFCFHGTCRFLILEETPACVCHPGFIGMRCEHADLLAIVATNQRQQTVATLLMLCILGSVLLILLCTMLNFWWRRGSCRQGSVLYCFSGKSNRIIKRGTSFGHSETVV